MVAVSGRGGTGVGLGDKKSCSRVSRDKLPTLQCKDASSARSEFQYYGRCWADAWQMLGRCLADAWQILGRYLSDACQMLGVVEQQVRAWQTLGRRLADAWQMLVRRLSDACQTLGVVKQQILGGTSLMKLGDTWGYLLGPVHSQILGGIRLMKEVRGRHLE